VKTPEPLVEMMARARRPPRVLTLADELAQTVDSLMARRKLDPPHVEGQAPNNGVGLLSRVLADYREARTRLDASVTSYRTKLAESRQGKVRVLKKKRAGRGGR
jgi:hypothetical protein